MTSRRSIERWRHALTACLVAVSAVLVACRGPETSDRSSVVLIVLDTVRQDRVTPCGYERPTTPTLEAIAKEGTTFCRMITPGTWTVPVHASILSGQLPLQHGADFSTEGVHPAVAELLTISPLSADIPLLTEILRDDGYQTALISQNPLLREELGFWRGFSTAWIPAGFPAGRDALVAPRVRETLRELDPDDPYFILINIFIAHGPYEPIRPGTEGFAPTKEGIFLFDQPFQESLFVRYVTNEMTGDERTRFRQRLDRLYDWGVRLADADLDSTIRVLHDTGFLQADTTLIVTSDHGEMLGERGLLDHGRTVAPENVDAFAVAIGPQFQPGTASDALTQSQDLYATVLTATGHEDAVVSRHSIPLQEIGDDRMAMTFSQRDQFWTEITDGLLGDERMLAVEGEHSRIVWREENPIFERQPRGTEAGSERAREAARLEEVARLLRPRLQDWTLDSIPASEELLETVRSLGYAN